VIVKGPDGANLAEHAMMVNVLRLLRPVLVVGSSVTLLMNVNSRRMCVSYVISRVTRVLIAISVRREVLAALLQRNETLLKLKVVPFR